MKKIRYVDYRMRKFVLAVIVIPILLAFLIIGLSMLAIRLW